MKENREHFATYSLTYFFLFGAISIFFPFFPLVLQQKGLTPSRIGFLMGCYDLISISGLMFLGRAYDQHDSPRRTITMICGSCILLFFLLVRSQSIFLIIPLTLALGFFVKPPTSLIDALYGQTMQNPKESYGKARLFGSISYALTLAVIHLTGLVSGEKPMTVFTGYALMLAVTIGIIRILPVEQIHTKKEEEHLPFFSTIKSFPPIYWVGMSIAFLNALGMVGHNTFFSLLMKNRFDTPAIGGAWAIGPILEIPLFFFSGYLLRRFSLKRLWLVGLASGFIRMQVYSLSTTLLPLYAVQIIHGLSFGLNHLCIITLINHVTSPKRRGLAMSLYTALGIGAPLFIGGLLGGAILHYRDFPLLYQIFSLFPLLGGGISIFFLKGHREITEEF